MSKKNEEVKIRFPFFQVKAAGHVVEHTNKEDVAYECFKKAATPAEMWEIHSNGSAKLIRQLKA